MRLRDNYTGKWYIADEGKHFVLTEKGKLKCKSYAHKTVGESVDEYDTEAVWWAVEKEYVEEVPIPDWVETVGYQVVYDYRGHQLTAGNSIIFPKREIAEKYMQNYQQKDWMDEKLYIKEVIYKGRELKPCKEYNGKPVYDELWYYGTDALNVGDYVVEKIVDDMIDCLPPVCMNFGFAQCGEPYSSRIDGKGKQRTTYTTFKKITDDVWEYCGDCFKGEDYQHGEEPRYV